MSGDRLRLLFCLPTSAMSGGVKVVFEVGTRLARRGHSVELFSYAGGPRWHDVELPLLPSRHHEDIDPSRYDFVLASNAFFLPLLLPIVGERLVFHAQDYESFHHSPDGTYEGFMAESAVFRDLYRLPVPIVTTSAVVKRLIHERVGRDAWHAPIGIRKDVFVPRAPRERSVPARILFVGNYLMPYKGMADGFEALRILSATRDVELVLATQEDRNRRLFDELPYRKEIHLRPPEDAMPGIYASADIYCCSSWYEGLGMPALEAFCCGVPVVSTKTMGVDEYGVDGVNVLIADANNPVDLAAKLASILDEPGLADRLTAGGFEAVRTAFEWEAGVDALEGALRALHGGKRPPVLVNAAELEALLVRLEDEGGYTPIAVFRRHSELTRQIEEILAEVATDGDCVRLGRLQELRDEVSAYLVNPRAQYHRAFRATFDLCQVVLALGGRADFVPLLDRIFAARKGHAPHTSPSLTEIRYIH